MPVIPTVPTPATQVSTDVTQRPDYPTAPPRPAVALRAVPPASGSTKKDSDVISFDGELFLLDDTPARPVYYPAVVFEGYREEPWLTAQFEVGPNGRFRVTLLEGTGDANLDAQALETLKQWRWKPRTEGRRPVASTVIKRLKAYARATP